MLIQGDFSQQRLNVINALPIHFMYLRNQLGRVLINIGYKVYNDNKESLFAGELFHFVERLECGEEYKMLGKKNFNIIKDENVFYWVIWPKLLTFLLVGVKIYYGFKLRNNLNRYWFKYLELILLALVVVGLFCFLLKFI